MKYYGHSIEKVTEERWQLLSDHLENTSNLVVEFSQDFCEKAYAKNLGLLHDVGKYQEAFQDRLKGNPTPVEHSVHGALVWKAMGLPESGLYCIVGHHGGLLDIGTNSDTVDGSSLISRIKRGEKAKADYSAYENEITLEEVDKFPAKNSIVMSDNDNVQKEYAFWTRMMFSCLTDADFIDTEKFYYPNISRGNAVNLSVALEKVNALIDSFKADTDIKKVRNNLREQTIQKANQDNEIYFLNMPTGSGKTLTSMQFALNRVVNSNKKRIIYVIPFTSIIEQNSKVFKDILGEDAILEHHSNFDYDEINDDSIRGKLMRASENWDADIIVTTNVQFFQSLYGNKSSQVRKLHNIANSIILFDEVHMLPTTFFKPCLDGIRILTQRYNCEAVFMSATMPDFGKWLEEFGCKNMKTCDLIDDKSEFHSFKRCEIQNLQTISMDELLTDIQAKSNSLIVVNKKATAKILYNRLNIKKYHLSTYMTHFDRDKTIKAVRKSLANGEQFCLVSTSLIEAGVDLDFDFAYRELSGLENLLQTAGRCNREGKKQNCITYSFSFEEEEYQIKNNDIKTKQSFTRSVFEQFPDVESLDAINFYFDRLYGYWKDDMESMDFDIAIKSSSCCKVENVGFDFKAYAEKFKLIDSNSISLVIMYDIVKDIFQDNFILNKSIKRDLQKYTINLREYEFKQLIEQGVVNQEKGLNILTNMNYYFNDTGIDRL